MTRDQVARRVRRIARLLVCVGMLGSLACTRAEAQPTPPHAGLVFPPRIPQPRAPGDIVGLVIENERGATRPAQFITFGQVFAAGEVPAGHRLAATLGGKPVAAQLDVKTAYPDGSARMGIVTLPVPALPARATLPAMLRLAPEEASAPPVDLAQALARDDLSVELTLHGPDGAREVRRLEPAKLLIEALSNGSASFWLRGPLAFEARTDVPIMGSLHLVLDLRAYADGATHADLQFANDLAMQKEGGAVTYDVLIRQGGRPVFQTAGLHHFQYQVWHREFWSRGAPDLNVQHDIAALERTGAVLPYDLGSGVSAARLAEAAKASSAPDWDAPLAPNGVTKYMPMTGDRDDIGPTTAANALWLVTQNAQAARYALGQAAASGSIPWHFRDPSGGWIRLTEHPMLWPDDRAQKDRLEALTQPLTSESGWELDGAHQPDLSFVPFLLTGSRRHLDELNAQAAWNLISGWPAEIARNGGAGILVNPVAQVRGAAWALRQVDEAAWANPDGSPEKAYFTGMAANNWHRLLDDARERPEGPGIIWGTYGDPNLGRIAPWQQDYFALVTAAAALRGNADALAVLRWQLSFIAGRFLHQADGFDPHDGIAYNIVVYDGPGGHLLPSWGAIGRATRAAGLSNEGGWKQTGGDYGQLALASLAAAIAATGAPDAIRAYAWLSSSGAPFTSPTDRQNAPKLNIVPPPEAVRSAPKPAPAPRR